MKNSKKISGVLALSLLAVASAFAGNSNTGKLKVPVAVTVGDKQIPAGEYQVEWTGTGSAVEVTISSGKETIAKVPAQVLPLNKPSTGNGYGTFAAQDGSLSLTDIFFGGKKF